MSDFDFDFFSFFNAMNRKCDAIRIKLIDVRDTKRVRHDRTLAYYLKILRRYDTQTLDD